MKANELMVGDWVMWKDKPVQVVRVSGVVYEFGHIDVTLAHCNENVLESHDIKSISPIPLTDKILEKNEFTHSFGDSDFYDYEKWEKKVDDKTIRVIKDHDGWFCRVDDSKLTRSMGIAPAVHTMQNIIRIGGIESTFKI